jgi:hypothetical protein
MAEANGERVTRNDALFQEVNERIEVLVEGVATMVGDLDRARERTECWVCECRQADCVERIELSVAEYKRLRAHGDWFVVAPAAEHVEPQFERVIGRERGYWLIVGIAGAAGESVAEPDPRHALAGARG